MVVRVSVYVATSQVYTQNLSKLYEKDIAEFFESAKQRLLSKPERGKLSEFFWFTKFLSLLIRILYKFFSQRFQLPIFYWLCYASLMSPHQNANWYAQEDINKM